MIADFYIPGESPVHRLSPPIKILCAVGLILLIALTPPGGMRAYVAFFALIMALTLLAGLDPLRVVRRSWLALPFAGAALGLLFSVPGQPIGELPLLGWAITDSGLLRFAEILFKSALAVQVASLLSFTTPVLELFRGLRGLGLPGVLARMLEMTYRYLFVLADEAGRLNRARRSRGATRGRGPGLRFEVKASGRLVGVLLTRGLGRTERVYQAMAARGYGGEAVLQTTGRIGIGEILAAAGILLAGALILLLLT
jgi:cobalt/nickel transport system permease protein